MHYTGTIWRPPYESSSLLLEATAGCTHHTIQTYFPENKTIGCFSRITDISSKSEEELKILRQAGYDSLTIGMETADNGALKFMNKGC